MHKIQITLASFLLFVTFARGQDDGKLKLIRLEAAMSDKLFESLSAKYRLTKTVSPVVVKQAGNSASILSTRKATIDGIWYRDRYATKLVSKSTMGDGSIRDDVNIFSYSGRKTYQNQNYKNGVVLPVRACDNEVNPRFFGAPIYLGRLGTMDQILNVQSENAPFGSATRYWKNCAYKYLGEEKSGELSCHKIEISRMFPDPPVRVLQRTLLWIAPERNWQIAASRYYSSTDMENPQSKARVIAWKEVEKGLWIPAKAETKYFGDDKAGKRIERNKKEFELVSCELKCDPKDKRFNDVDFRPDMKVQLLDPIKNTAKTLEIK